MHESFIILSFVPLCNDAEKEDIWQYDYQGFLKLHQT